MQLTDFGYPCLFSYQLAELSVYALALYQRWVRCANVKYGTIPPMGFIRQRELGKKSVSPRADGNSFLGDVISNLLLEMGWVLKGSVRKVSSLGTRHKNGGYTIFNNSSFSFQTERLSKT